MAGKEAHAPGGPAAEGRREAILEATLRVIAAGGPDEVTHRRVAAEAAVPLGSTTYYFASRDELVRDAFRHYVGKVFAFLGTVERDVPRRGTEDVVEFLTEVARREVADPESLLIEYELIVRAARDPVLAAAFNDYARALESRLAEWLEGLGAPQPFDAARTLIALVRGVELQRLTRPDIDVGDLRRRLHAVVGAIVGAVGGPADAAPAARRRSRPRAQTRAQTRAHSRAHPAARPRGLRKERT